MKPQPHDWHVVKYVTLSSPARRFSYLFVWFCDGKRLFTVGCSSN